MPIEQTKMNTCKTANETNVVSEVKEKNELICKTTAWRKLRAYLVVCGLHDS